MTEETINLGELFRQKLKGQKVVPSPKAKKRKESTRYGESGIRMVAKRQHNGYPKGYCFRLQYKDENGRTKHLYRKTLMKLYEDAREINQKFIVGDVKKARDFIDENTKNNEDCNYLLNEIIGDKE